MIVQTASGNEAVIATARIPSTSLGHGWASGTYTDRPVTVESANAVSAWHSATTLISWAFSYLPLRTLDYAKGYPIEVVGGRIAPMLRDVPNPDMHASVLWPLQVRHLLNRGNAYLAKYFVPGDPLPVATYPINPERVLPFRDDYGKKWFQVWNPTRGRESFDYFDQGQITHIIGHPDDEGLEGVSLVEQMRERLGVAQSASEFQQRHYRQGTVAAGILKSPQGQATLTRERRLELAADWRAKYTGRRNAHGVVILEPGWDYQPIGLTHQQQQFLEQLEHGVDEIASWLHVPASKINGRGSSDTYKNAEQDDLSVVKWAMMPWIGWVEGGLKRDPDFYGELSTWHPQFDLRPLLRADEKTRSEIADRRIRNSTLAPDEDRSREGLPPRGGVGAKFTDELAAEGIARFGAPTPQPPQEPAT